MGFLSGLSGILGGGSQAKSSGSTQSGWSLLPSQIQNAYTNYANSVNAQIPNATAAYTPMQLTSGENTALNSLTQGYTPTAQSLASDVSMFMNPYQSYVEDPVNRSAASDYSILKQDLGSSGQLGSNRQRLGANDIEQTRLSTIGNLRQGAYNTAMSNVLNNLIPQRQQDAQNALAAGTYQRGIYNATQQAPITGLQQIGQALGVLPTSGGSTSTQGSSSSSSNSGTAGNLLSTAASIASLFSDKNLKENIKPIGIENGHNVYEFNYKGDDRKYIGVLAQEVEKIDPDAVSEICGYKAVNYNKIGVEFRYA